MPNTEPIYLDNHATTRVDPRVVDAMLPYFTERYGNAGSPSHVFGWQAKEAVDEARQSLAAAVNARPTEIVFTSGATESNNLAIRGAAERRQAQGRHVIGVVSEHRAVLDPLDRLARQGFDVTLLEIGRQDSSETCGQIDLDALESALRPDTAVVTVMLANNEIGVIQPIRRIAEICQAHDALLHCDATQAVGKVPVDVKSLGVDLMSFSAHKLYGPKGVGALFVRRRSPQIRLVPQIVGGGQEKGFRSGTLPVPLIVGFARAVELCGDELHEEITRLGDLRERLFRRLTDTIPDCHLNGPSWGAPATAATRLPHNLNVRFDGVDGESLMLSAARVAMSSGSACTSASPEPSHVLRALGLSEDESRSSLRFGLGRFNQAADIEAAAESISDAVSRLRKMG